MEGQRTGERIDARRRSIAGGSFAGVLIPLLALAILATACSSGGQGPGPSTSPSTVASVSEFTAANVDATIERLAQAGIAVYEDTGEGGPIIEPAAPVSPLRLLRWQARNLALEEWSEAGNTGGDLDALDPPLPDGAPPMSAWLAAYTKGAQTPGGDYARELVGNQDLADVASVRFPMLVPVLFAADFAARLPAEPPVPASPVAAAEGDPGAALLAAPDFAVGAVDPCGAFSGFISSTIDSILKAVHIPPAKIGDTGSTLLTQVLQAGADLVVGFLNWIVGEGISIVIGAVKYALAPILKVIATIAGVMAIASEIVSAVRPWTVRVTADPNPTRKGIEDEVLTTKVTASVDLGGLSEWPPQLTSCASLAGVPLPNLKPTGAPVTWVLATSPEGLASIDRKDEKLRASAAGGEADFILRMANEPREFAINGDLLDGTLLVRASIRRTQLEDAKRSILGLMSSLLGGLPAPIRDQVVAVLSVPLDEVLNKLLALVDEKGEGEAVVVFHGPPEETPTPSVPPTPSGSPTPSPSLTPSGGPVPHACDLITAADITSITGSEVKILTRGESGSSTQCFYIGPGEDIGIGVDSRSPIPLPPPRRGTPIGGIGDEAYVIAQGDEATVLVFRVGSVAVTLAVGTENPRADAVTLANLAISRL